MHRIINRKRYNWKIVDSKGKIIMKSRVKATLQMRLRTLTREFFGEELKIEPIE